MNIEVKRLIASILVFYVVVLLFYLLGAAISWNLNPALWQVEIRSVMALFGLLVGIFLQALPILIHNSPDALCIPNVNQEHDLLSFIA